MSQTPNKGCRVPVKKIRSGTRPSPRPPEKNRTRSIAWRIHGVWLARLFWLFFLLDAALCLLLLGSNDQGQLSFDWRGLPGVFADYWPLLAVEGGVWLLQLLFGVGRIRQALRPLETLGQTVWDEARFQQLEEAIGQIAPGRADAALHLQDEELQGLESAVNNLLERMRQSYRQQIRFVSDASHELRTPISVIQGYTAMLDRWGKTDPKVLEEGIAAIKAEAESMSRLVEQLLFLARGDSGRTMLQKSRFSLSALLREVREESAMVDPDHQWRLNLSAQEVFLFADSGLIKQAVRILTDNARKFSDPGTPITLALSVRPDGTLALSVQDEGIGLAPQDIPHICQRFYRADPARTRQRGGSGLGLSIASWIVEKHGGSIEVLSRLQLGTRITLCLPPQ